MRKTLEGIFNCSEIAWNKKPTLALLGTSTLSIPSLEQKLSTRVALSWIPGTNADNHPLNTNSHNSKFKCNLTKVPVNSDMDTRLT